MDTIITNDTLELLVSQNSLTKELVDVMRSMIEEARVFRDITTPPALMTEKEAARYIAMSPIFLRKARCEGIVGNRTPAPRYVEMGSSIRYEKEELDRWLAELPRKRARREAAQG